MAVNLQKIGICVLTLVAIGVLQQRPVWALTTASAQAISITENSLDVNSSQIAHLQSMEETTGESNSKTNELLLLAERNIEKIIQNNQVSMVTLDETTRYYVAQTPAATQDSFIPSYRNVWVKLNDAPIRRKVPEPSALLGLVAMVGWLVTQGQTKQARNLG
ncbi:hypothetical protein I8752_17300 [Nostocaceae cyanobacterium CENA369]|uniref:Uncharacterized protein n=1 Tax=Dendronalium phyllosphericum CENA369 TaxID=1725256 RepID=A0A8J7LEA8_9NOST|nr:hypothetical protein [Dendronalium phyllosphericum]MBH8574747.1 hypothetical protein [Dendronalium phyllosphericum CENA369]